MSGNSELIKYPERMAQLKSYRELFIGKHTPSDIDLAYEIINVGRLPVVYMWYTVGGEIKTMENVNRNVSDVCNQYIKRFVPDL